MQRKSTSTDSSRSRGGKLTPGSAHSHSRKTGSDQGGEAAQTPPQTPPPRPLHAPPKAPGQQAATTVRSNWKPFALPARNQTQTPPGTPRSMEDGRRSGLRPQGRNPAQPAWQRLLGGDPPLLVQSGTSQAPRYGFTQRSVPSEQLDAVHEACADAWAHSPAQGLALLSAVCRDLDAPPLLASLLPACADALLAAAPSLSATGLSDVLQAVLGLAERGWCNPHSDLHVPPAVRQTLQTLADRHDAAQGRRLALHELEHRLRQPGPQGLNPPMLVELLTRLTAQVDKALDAQDLLLALRQWALVERAAALLPGKDATGLQAVACAQVKRLRATLQRALQREVSAGLGAWIRLTLAAPPKPSDSALQSIDMQPLPTPEAQALARAELQAWLQSQLRVPPAQRLLHWRDLQRVVDTVAPALDWQPTREDQLDWRLQHASHAHQAQPLCELLHKWDGEPPAAAELHSLLNLARDQAVPLGLRAQLLASVLLLLPPASQATALHEQCRSSIDALGDPANRHRLTLQYTQRFGTVPKPPRAMGPGSAHSDSLRTLTLPRLISAEDWSSQAQSLALRIRLSTPQQLENSGVDELLQQVHALWRFTEPQPTLAQLDQLLVCAQRLIERLRLLPGGAPALLRSRCEQLRKRLTDALRQHCHSGLSGWLEVARPTAGDDSAARWALRQLHPDSLGSEAEREQAWALFLRWLTLEMAEPQGPSWPQAHALILPVAQALQRTPDPATVLTLRLRAALRVRDAAALRALLQSEPDTALTDATLLPELVQAVLQVHSDDPDWLALESLLQQRLQRHADPELQQSEAAKRLKERTAVLQRPVQALSRWLSIERRRGPSGHLHLVYKIHRDVPQDEDEAQLAQWSVINWMSAELQNPEHIDWAELLDLLSHLQERWGRRFDRQDLLALCLWHVGRTHNPGPLLKLLPWLEDETAKGPILLALLEQARKGQWSPVVRATLLQSIVKWLPTPTPENDGLHAQVLQAVLLQEDAGMQANLLAAYRQRFKPPQHSAMAQLLSALEGWDTSEPLRAKALIRRLASVPLREDDAPRAQWFTLCHALLERAVPPLLKLARAGKPGRSDRAADALLRALWHMARTKATAETGDGEAQASADQFALLQTFGALLPSPEQAAWYDWLDRAAQRLIQRALERQGGDTAPRLPIATLALRGAIAALSAVHRAHHSTGPTPVNDALSDALGQFFADWFCALQAQASGASDADTPTLALV